MGGGRAGRASELHALGIDARNPVSQESLGDVRGLLYLVARAA